MAQGFRISNFHGLHEQLLLGQQPDLTDSLDNVRTDFGRVIGRKGIAKYRSISTVSATTPIIGLASLVDPDLTTSLIRVTPTRVEKLNTGTDVWDNVTGAATLGASSTTRPQFDMIDDTLVFTTEGTSRPWKYTGTGNIAAIGGTPPYAKALASYLGFLMLGNVSDNGTFTDVTNGPLIIRYSDDWDTSWDLCANNELTLEQTPGEIRAFAIVGRSLLAFKSDGIVAIRFIGGNIRFTQELLPFRHGIIAPLSVGVALGSDAIFLATDQKLYITDGQQVRPLELRASKTLQTTLSVASAKDSVAVIDPDEDTYHLYYNRTGGTWLDGRVSYNYRTGDFYKYSYTGHAFTRAHTFRLSQTSSYAVIASTTDLVYEMDTGTDDDGTRIVRTYDTGWQNLGSPGDKYFYGAQLVLKKAADVRVKVSVAQDMSSSFGYERVFELKGGLPAEAEVKINYTIPGIFGSWFNVRIKIIHGGSTNVGEMRELTLLATPVRDEQREPQRGARGKEG